MVKFFHNEEADIMKNLHRATPGSLCLLLFALPLLMGGCGDDGGIFRDDTGTGDAGPRGDRDIREGCADTDGDTICDTDEGTADIDGDSLPNSEDPDSDGDGVLDSEEAGDTDPTTPPRDSDGDGIPDFLDALYPNAPDAGLADGDVPPPPDDMIPEECSAPENFVPRACLRENVNEGDENLCDGTDNDCDGDVDDGCECAVGTVQSCTTSTPGRRNVGACRDGQQVCVSRADSEFFGAWGPCVGGIQPREEVCDGLDNDCNGCVDELPPADDGSTCEPIGRCPGPGDDRVPDGHPFETYPLDGSQFVEDPSAIVSYSWEVRGSPCDQLFQGLEGSPATSTNGQLSYVLRDADQQNAEIDFTLSGDYEITLTVERNDGAELSCSWIVPVVAPGLRVELCWDKTGPVAGSPLDIDLHLAKQGTTPAFFEPQDCYFANCKGDRDDSDLTDFPNWGYPNTSIENCTGPGARGTFSDSCPNPRLDIDNIFEDSEFVPENINVDNPNHDDRFRVLVQHWDSDATATTPLVNIYCGGTLKGTFGQAPDVVEGFDEGGGSCGGDMWRVVDVRVEVDDEGNTTDCLLRPIRDLENPTFGHFVTTDECSYTGHGR